MFEQTFKNIDDVLWKDAGCTSELDYEDAGRAVGRRADPEYAKEGALTAENLTRRLAHEKCAQHQATQGQCPFATGKRHGCHRDRQDQQHQPNGSCQHQPRRRDEDAHDDAHDDAGG